MQSQNGSGPAANSAIAKNYYFQREGRPKLSVFASCVRLTLKCITLNFVKTKPVLNGKNIQRIENHTNNYMWKGEKLSKSGYFSDSSRFHFTEFTLYFFK